MPQIRPLPAHVVAKIAAGEVIERPASVIKELVENALDAQAKHIIIEIEQAGLKKIRVIDDGCGMEKDDLLECFKPHTTSKLHDDDLFAIETLGFRGEALSSVAAISRLRINSRTADAATGNSILVQNRTLTDHGPLGMRIGTQVEVDALFAKAPVRKQFLASHRTETYQITRLITKIALSHPAVGFQVKHNRRKLLDLPENQSIAGRLHSLFGKTLTGNLLPLHHTADEITISGFIGAPQIAVRSNKRQYLFVNARLFRNAAINSAIKEAYGTLLDPHSHPSAFLFLYLPTNQIDVNIHPRKEEVKFLNRVDLIDAIKHAIQTTLQNHHLVARPFQSTIPVYEGEALSPATVQDAPASLAGYTAVSSLLKNQKNLWSPRNTPATQDILQIHNTYLITASPQGVRLIDQHAAHERILYEELLDQTRQALAEKRTHSFTTARVLEFPFAEAQLLEQHLETFASLGFQLEPFGTNLFKLNAAPELLAHLPLNRELGDILHIIAEETIPDLTSLLHRIIALFACRSAIKAGDPLSPDERKNLLKKLNETNSNYTCPHGRPAEIEISLYELESLFRRR